MLLRGLSRMRREAHVRFLGGGGAAMRCRYPTISEVIGLRPQIAPKKHVAALLWQSGTGAREAHRGSAAGWR